MEVVEPVFGQARPIGIADDASLLERRCRHASLDALDEIDVLHLEDPVEVADRFEFGLCRFGGFIEEVVGLVGEVDSGGDELQDAEVPATGVAHHGGVGP